MICVNLFLICVSRILSGISTQLFRNVFRVPLWYKWLLGYRMWLFKENYFRILQKWKYMRPNDRIQFFVNSVRTYFLVNLPHRKFWFFELSFFDEKMLFRTIDWILIFSSKIQIFPILFFFHGSLLSWPNSSTHFSSKITLVWFFQF